MRSPADVPVRGAARLTWERVARVGALGLLAVALWRALAAFGAPDVPRVHVQLDGGAGSAKRDSLAAVAAAGTVITWSGDIAPVAAMTEPVREPTGGAWRVSVVSRAGTAISDGLGALDSLSAGGGTITTAGVRGALDVRDGVTVANTSDVDAATVGRVLVLARAGWEAKFVIAALEEQGWDVDARLRVGDGVYVTQGGSASTVPAPSIARHAAVVVLDTAVGRDAAGIMRFVRSGGGLVMAGEGVGAPSLAAVVPARSARALPAESPAFEGDEPTHALALHALGGIRPDAVVLERRDADVAAAARRVGAGRVVQMGYAETWRWRMQGEGASVSEHRDYWSRLVGSVAAVRLEERGVKAAPGNIAALDSAASSNAAPLASTVHALGAPLAAPPDEETGRGRRDPLPAWLGPLILALLVAEWASRRTRGAA